MDEKIFRRLVPGLKSAFRKKQLDMSSPSPDADGMFFLLWSWVLPLLFGLTVGWFGMTCFNVWLEGLNGQSRHMAVAHDPAAFAQEAETDNMAAFLKTNPFKVAPMPGPAPEEPKVDETPPPVVGSLTTAILRGTSPGHMAWLEDEGNLRLVMLGSSFDAYTLEEVTYIDATFAKDDAYVVKKLAFGRGPQTASAPVRRMPEWTAEDYARQIVPTYQGGAGVGNDFSYEELGKLRLAPAGGGREGVKVDWIDADSIFTRAGLETGDVIRVINDAAINTVMDMTNLLNSLEDKYQFNIEVQRNGETLTLEYHVR